MRTPTLLLRLVALVALVASAACAEAPAPPTETRRDPHSETRRTPPAETRPAPAADARRLSASGPVLGSIRTRDHVLTLIATGHGPLLTLSAADGSVIARELQPAELERTAPELGALYRRSVAAEQPLLDARLDPRLRAAGRSVLDKSDVEMHMRTR